MSHGRSHFGGTPAEWGGLNGADPENTGVGHGISKLGGECFCWFLQVSVYLVWGREWGTEKLHLPALLFLETFLKDPCHSSIHSEISK